ncbi:nickel pincer cofactor biosynthesis protein LarB [Mangrovibacterium lignilyticum]|uniref:nickel pincer cofactor biosynthesis protein LarB n=1 Tax=Mangrovibacterium lignilyticum TaxID=2668052 RepID=UPI0013D3E2FD|nr:nickel pincer cofactor biosynthesis protein LarB [Mangrovibacterium lignilyticum]
MSPREILERYKDGEITLTEALEHLPKHGIEEMGFATIDTDREQRTGLPEVIYASGKTAEQVAQIAERMHQKGIDVLATRATPDMFEAVKQVIPGATYNELAKTIVYRHSDRENSNGYIAVVAAGTSDMPVAEEAVETARFLGNKVESVYDVGVAGIHRLFNKLELIRNARVIIVVAGMEGALTSVVGGLVDKPVIGVPTSVGYGANFEGLSALLAMLNSCASGVSVVNINNGFGAACQASLINKL